VIDQTISFHSLLKITPDAKFGIDPFGATDRDEDIVTGGIEYKVSLGYTPSNLDTDNDLAPGNSEVEGFLSSIGVNRSLIENGVFDNAFLEWMLYDSDTDTVVKTILSGYWGQCQMFNNRYVAEFRSLSQVLQNPVVELISRTCKATFCDAKCGLDIATYTRSGIVTAANIDKLYFEASAITETDNFFKYGYVIWKSGNNDNGESEVAQSDENGNFRLFEPASYSIHVGDTFHLVEGCDKLKSTCIGFSNIVNFRGMPDLPGDSYVRKSYKN